MSVAFVQATHNQEAYSTRQGMALAFQTPVTAGNALITVIVGKRNADPYTAGATSDPYAKDLDDNGPVPVISDGAGVTTGWVQAATAKLRDIDALETTGSNFDDESKPNYDGAYDSIFIGQKVQGVSSAVIAAGETIKIMNAYIGAQSTTTQDNNGAAGVSIYNEGVNAVAMEFSGVTGAATAQGRTTVANPALSGASTIGGTGNLQIAVGLCKNGNVFGASTGWTVVYADKCVVNQEHFVVAYKILSGADHASFDNPLGMEMAVITLNLT